MSPLCAPRAAAPPARLHLNRSGRAALPAPGRLRRGVYLARDQPIFVATSGERAHPRSVLPLSPVPPPCSALCPRRCRWLVPFGFSDTAGTPTPSPPATGDDGHRGSPAPEPATGGGCRGRGVPGLRGGRAGPRHAAGRAPGAGQAEHPGQAPLANQAQRPPAPGPGGSADRAPQDASAALGRGRHPWDAPGRPRPTPASRDRAAGIRDAELCGVRCVRVRILWVGGTEGREVVRRWEVHGSAGLCAGVVGTLLEGVRGSRTFVCTSQACPKRITHRGDVQGWHRERMCRCVVSPVAHFG